MLIQKLRLQRGWSQEQLAEVSGVSVRTVQRLERGQPGSPETLKALAAVFDIDDFNRLKEPAVDAPASALRTPDLRPDEALALAHVRKVKRFYIHLIQYLIFIPALARKRIGVVEMDASLLGIQFERLLIFNERLLIAA